MMIHTKPNATILFVYLSSSMLWMLPSAAFAAHDEASFKVNHNPHSVNKTQSFDNPIPSGNSVELLGHGTAGTNVQSIQRTERQTDPNGLISFSMPGTTTVHMTTRSDRSAGQYPLGIGGKYVPETSGGGSGGSGGSLLDWSGMDSATVKKIEFRVRNKHLEEVTLIMAKGNEFVLFVSPTQLVNKIEDELEQAVIESAKDAIKDAIGLVNPVEKYAELLKVVFGAGLEIVIVKTRVKVAATLEYKLSGNQWRSHTPEVTAKRTAGVKQHALIWGSGDSDLLKQSIDENVDQAYNDLDEKIEDKKQEIRNGN